MGYKNFVNRKIKSNSDTIKIEYSIVKGNAKVTVGNKY